MSSTSANKILSFVRNVWQDFRNFRTFDSLVLGKMSIAEANNGKVIMEFPIEKEHLNGVESLHGGVIATLVDIGGSLAIASKGLHATGVSTDLNVSYLSGAKLNEVLIIDARCVKLGKTLAFTTVDLLNKETGKLIAQGRHTKYVVLAHKNPKNVSNL